MTGVLSRAVALLATVAVAQAATTTKPTNAGPSTGAAADCKSILQIGKDHDGQFSTLLKLVKAAGLDKVLGNKSMSCN